MLLASSGQCGPYALDRFASACIKVAVKLVKVSWHSRNPSQCALQVSGIALQQVEKFKYVQVLLTSDETQNKETETGIGEETRCFMSFIVPRSRNGSFQPQKRFPFSNRFCSDPHSWSAMLGHDRKRVISNSSGKDGIFTKSSQSNATWQSAQLWMSWSSER